MKTPKEAIEMRIYAKNILLNKMTYEQVLKLNIDRGFTKDFIEAGLKFWAIVLS